MALIEKTDKKISNTEYSDNCLLHLSESSVISVVKVFNSKND